MLNPLQSVAAFLYLQRTSENWKVFWCFQGYRKATPGCNGLNSLNNKSEFWRWYRTGGAYFYRCSAFGFNRLYVGLRFYSLRLSRLTYQFPVCHIRSTHLRVFYKKCVLKSFTKPPATEPFFNKVLGLLPVTSLKSINSIIGGFLWIMAASFIYWQNFTTAEFYNYPIPTLFLIRFIDLSF